MRFGYWNPNFAAQLCLESLARRGVTWGGAQMANKIIGKANRPDAAGDDLAALADQLIQDSWHLPPGGDQSWREQDALRIFSGHGKDEINDTEEPSAIEDIDPSDDGNDAPYQPGFKPPGRFGILLPLAMATGLMLLVVAVSAPGILTSAFWNTPAAKAAPEAALAPVNMVNAAVTARQMNISAPDKLRPSLAYDGQIAHARTLVAKAKHPASTTVAVARHDRITKARLAQASVARGSVPHAKRGRLPPIGEAYFASHAITAKSTKTAAMDWKAEAAKWDEMANQIRARNERYQKSGNTAAVESHADSASEFP